MKVNFVLVEQLVSKGASGELVLTMWRDCEAQRDQRRAADRERKAKSPKRKAKETSGTDTTVKEKSPFHELWVEADWQRFWDQFPNKVGKADALKAFGRATKKISPEILFPALTKYVSKTDDRPFCNPATWLNQERWLDEPAKGNGNRNNGTRNRSASDDFFAGMSGLAADIAGDSQPPGNADAEIPRGRFEIDG